MRSLERGRQYESIDASLARIAYAYGFTNSPVQIPKKALALSDDPGLAASAALVKSAASAKSPTHVWGSARGPKGGTTLSFAIVAARHAVAHVLVVEAARSVAELAGFTDLTVLVSSVGDQESKRRFARELGNFFRKNVDSVPAELKHAAAQDPESAYRTLLAKSDPLVEKAPHAIDFLSENSRKTMLETLALFESIGVQYVIDPLLPADPGFHAELIFAIDGTDRKGVRSRIASGGRFDELLKKNGSNDRAVSVSVVMPDRVEPELVNEAPVCFVVHVGDAAKLKTFGILTALWKANFTVTQALMADTLREQIDRARSAGARYLAIVGQREALDGTVIVRNLATQLQMTVPADKLVGQVGRR
jgi:histidyl-tRNA synthetase